jgi:hypothetical protein
MLHVVVWGTSKTNQEPSAHSCSLHDLLKFLSADSSIDALPTIRFQDHSLHQVLTDILLQHLRHRSQILESENLLSTTRQEELECLVNVLGSTVVRFVLELNRTQSEEVRVCHKAFGLWIESLDDLFYFGRCLWLETLSSEIELIRRASRASQTA